MVFMDIINLDDTGDLSESGIRFCACTSTPMSRRSNKKKSPKPNRVAKKVKRNSAKMKRVLNGIANFMNSRNSRVNQENNADSTFSTLDVAHFNQDNSIDCSQVASTSLCNTSSIKKDYQNVKSKKKRKRSRSQNKSNKVVIIESDDDCVCISDVDISDNASENISNNTPENNKVENSDCVLCLSDASVIELSDSEDVGVVAGTFETAKTGWENLKKSISDINTDTAAQETKFDFTNKRDVSVMRRKLRKVIRPQTKTQESAGQQEKLEGTSSKNSVAPKTKSPTASHANSISYLPSESHSPKKNDRRPIVIDGSNVAFGHGKDKFSSKGIEICVDYFLRRRHKTVVAFIPQFRRRHPSTTDYEILDNLESKGHLIYTPSRLVGDRRITSYDDRYIVEYAYKTGGIIISRDNFLDLLAETPAWGDTIRFRVLQPTFVGDMIMFPKDPLGRGGPTLDKFLMYDD